MTSNLPEIPLAEIVTIKGGKRLPAGKNLQSIPSKHPYIRVRDVGQRSLPREGIEYVPDDVFPSISRYIVQRNDVVLSIVGTIGALSIVDSFYDYASLTENCVKLTGLDYYDALYLYYYLSSSIGQQEISQGTVGAVQPKLPIYNIEKIKVLWPEDKDRRKRIAAVLGELDDKIDINRCINQTLEAMAQAIFKSWFVDFDPVKAKIAAIQEGRDPMRAAMSAISGKPEAELDALPPEQYEQLAAVAALFPDEMEESELGDIPRGWTPTPIRDVAEVVKGKSYSSRDLVDNDEVALVTLKSFERGGGFRMDGFKPYVGPYKPEQVVLPGDLIVAYTDVTQAAELIGKPAVVVGVDHYKTLVASLDVGIVRPVNERVSRQFLYGLFMTDAFQAHTFAHTSGTTVLHLAKDGVPSYVFACPDERLVGSFSAAAEAMAMEKQKLLDQNQSLATLRDTLLPQLLSGELSVTGAAAEAEA